jgi:hypothetical protein
MVATAATGASCAQGALLDLQADAGELRFLPCPLSPAERCARRTRFLGASRIVGASAWRALSALLHRRLAFIGAPGHRLGGGGALDRTRRCAEERSGVHTEKVPLSGGGTPIMS